MKKSVTDQRRVTLIAVVLAYCLLQCSQVHGHPECPDDERTCDCRWGLKGIAFMCPTNELRMYFKIYRHDFIDIRCFDKTGNLGAEELAALLPEFDVGNNSRFDLSNCPLPEGKSVFQYFDRIHHNRVRAINFASDGANMNRNISNEHFEDLDDVEYFRLSGTANEFKNLPRDFFSRMTKLTSAIIKVPNIHLDDDLFAPLSELESLNLQGNQLKSLAPGFLANQSKLKTLQLAGNLLKHLSDDTFKGLDMLKVLGLSNNGLEQLVAGVFFPLTNLNLINLSGNNFASLPDGLFSNNKKISTFSLQDNRIALKALPNGLLANITELKEVLIKCGLEEIPGDVFKGSKHIEIIGLRENNLTSLSEDLFVDQSKLKVLDLSENLITHLPDEIFKNQKLLKELKMSKNLLKMISVDLLHPLRGLEILHLDYNRFNQIHFDAFKGNSKLKEIFLQNNQLTTSTPFWIMIEGELMNIPKSSPFQRLDHLKILNLAHNKMTQMFEDLTLSSLDSLNLSHNSFESFSTANLKMLADARDLTIDLSHNKIKTFTFNPRDFYERNNIKLLLPGNPFACDCRIHSFVQHLKNSSTPEKINLVNGLMCATPPKMINKLVADLSTNELLCLVEENCPDGCTCNYREDDKFLLLDCESLIGAFSENFHQLQSSFNQTELRMENKNLKTLPDLSDKNFKNIKKLLVSGNQLNKIAHNNLPPNVELIELHNNNLTSLNSNVTKFLKNCSMTLRNNPWRCDCSNWDFINFAREHQGPKKISDYYQMNCSEGNLQFYRIIEGTICPEDNPSYMILSIATASAGFLLAILAALYYKYQKQIKLWMFTHKMCLWWLTEAELDEDKRYDAFVSFSHQDEDFVTNYLLPVLEKTPTSYTLCVHERDWSPGLEISTQISNSINESRRIIIVMSPSYLKSKWGQHEFKVAQSHVVVEKRSRIIVILYEDIGDINKLDADIRDYLNINTYVKWGDKWFWEKLKYAMPHRDMSNQNNIEVQN